MSRSNNIDTEWKLSDRYFKIVVNNFGVPEIDLFATRANAKVKRSTSWFRDPEAYEIDAFTLNWGQWFFYAFPPFAVITRILQKILHDKATGILVVPNWPSQAWYPLYKSMVISEITLLGPKINMLLSPCRRTFHPLSEKLCLIVAVLSGNHSKRKD